MWLPRSAPFASASLIVCFTRSGPIESATTSPPCFSFSRSASSSAKLSGSFISKPISDSLIQFPVIASGASFAGTCLMHTIIFTGIFPYPWLRKTSAVWRLLPWPALENQRGVRSAKSERIGERIIHCRFARHVRHIVQITFRIGVELIDRRRQNLIAQRQHANAGFKSPRAAQKMSRHGFRRAHRQLLVDCAFAKQALHRRGFNDVAYRRGSSVRVYVADIVRRKLRVFQRRTHYAKRPVAIFHWLRDVIGVAGHSVANNLRQNRGVAPRCVLQRLQNQNSRAFSHDETITVRVKGTARRSGIIIARRERLHRGESAHAHRCNRGLSAAADHHIRRAALDNFERIANRMRRSRTSRRRRRIRPLRSITNRNMSRRQIHDCRRNKKWRNLIWPAEKKFPVLAFDDVEPTNSRRNVNAHFFEIRLFGFPIGVLHCGIRCGERELDEPPHFFQFFFLNPAERIEVLHFAGDLAVKRSRIKMSDRPNAANPFDEVLPTFVCADAKCADQPNSRYHYPASHGFQAPVRVSEFIL